MIQDVKKCFKLLRYGYSLKTNIACTLLFIGLGFVFLLFGSDGFMMATTYIFLGVMFVAQSMHMMLFSSWVGSAPDRRKLELRYLDIINVVCGAICVTIILLTIAIGKPKVEGNVSLEAVLAASGLIVCVLYMYMGVAFKSMFVGFLLFFPSFFGIMTLIEGPLGRLLTAWLDGNMLLAAVMFVAQVILGIILGHFCRKLLYKKDMSKFAKGAKLRMEQS